MSNTSLAGSIPMDTPQTEEGKAAASLATSVSDAAVLQTAGVRDALALKVQGQRKINILWERTQGYIAIAVTTVALACASYMIVDGNKETSDKAFQLIGNTLFVVIGFYFGRTNHQKTGGVGGSDSQDVGR